MTFTPAALLKELSRLESAADPPRRYIVALSGGLDSMVLTHAMAALYTDKLIAVPILAIYVDHGLQDESSDWREFCAAHAALMGVGFDAVEIEVPSTAGESLEAVAREERYAALQSRMKPGDWLLSAHHRDDQAETLLLNLIRGSGPAGIAGIAGIRRFGPGWLARPLLGTDKTAIEKYAADALLEWVNDPSNENRRFDRNYLRHDVFPALHSRWSDIATRLQRSAIHAGEAAVLLDELAAMDLEQRGRGLARLPIDKLRELSQARQRNAIRFALRELSLSTPATVHLDAVMHELLPAREDAQPIVRWPGACIRRYRNGLYLLPEKPCPKLKTVQFAAETVELGPGLGRLRLEPGGGLGLSQALVARGLRIECRVGGEEIKPYHQRHTRKLKNLLQEEGIVPWMRDRLPLVYSGERLIAVGDLWMADDAVTKPGVVLRWDDRPALQ